MMRKNKIQLVAALFLILAVLLLSAEQLPVRAKGLRGMRLTRADNLQDEMAAEIGVPEGEIQWFSDADTIGSFHFSSHEMYGDLTFENEIAITGTADAGSILYMGSFIVEKGSISLWESRITQIPQAGFVQEELALPRVGENLYVIVIEDESGLWGSVYQIERMSAKTEQKLMDLRVNLYEACAP